MGFTKNIKNSSFGPGRRKGFTIHFNIKGIGFFNGNIVNEGQGFIVYDGMHAHHYADKDNPWELMWFTITGACVPDILQQYKANPETNIFDFSSLMTARETAKKICTFNEISADSLKLLEIFLQLHCACTKQNNNKKQPTTTEIYIDYALKYIKDNIYRNVTVDELTHLIGISQPYLYRLFMQEFNMSPKQCIIRLKLDTAKNMLVNTDMTITEIANSVGYADILTFSRLFSTREKVSPTEYRNRH
ncbi:MAG: helix-turn-helix domain-containing protein [Clostridia bacterium]|nr:helix-turn-helix domain-containing protein [Clostridia bacterium]